MRGTSCIAGSTMLSKPDSAKPIDFSTLPQGLNTPTATIREHISQNIKRHLPQLAIYAPQDRELCIVAGGPSLKYTLEPLMQAIGGGAGVCAINGAYDWLLDRGIVADTMCLIDARQWNKRFVERARQKTKFFIASQCHPEVFDALDGHDVWLWHAPIPIMDGEDPDEWGEGKALYLKHYYDDRNFLLVPGGVSCTAKSIMLNYWLGFRKIHIFGFDSCWLDGEHHAYEQPENRDLNVEFWLGDKMFNCAPWMAHQADSFFKLMVNLPDNLQLQVHGDGLIAYGLTRSAEELERRVINVG